MLWGCNLSRHRLSLISKHTINTFCCKIFLALFLRLCLVGKKEQDVHCLSEGESRGREVLFLVVFSTRVRIKDQNPLLSLVGERSGRNVNNFFNN